MDHFFQNIDGWFDFDYAYQHILEQVPFNSHIVEVGSWKGKSAAYLAVEALKLEKGITVHCVDTWLGSDEDVHRDDPAVKSGKLFEEFCRNMQPVLKDNGGNVVIWRGPSVEIAQKIPDNEIAAVFIDASHDYDNVCADIKAWYPKVMKTGIMAGHDYESGHDGVVRAVRHTLPLHLVRGTCWFFLKPNI